MKVVTAGGLALCAAVTLGCSGSPDATVQERAREYTQRFYEGDLEGLHTLFTPEMAQQIPFPQFTEMHRSLREQLGDETEVVSETVEIKSPYRRYLRRARFEQHPGEIEINWLLREEDHSIAGVVFREVDARAAAGGAR